MADLSGQNLGRYHLIEKIGEGGMAVVYKAMDTQLERYVAIKVIQSYREHKEQFLARFKREAKSLAKLNHPNIIKILDYGEDNGTTYLVMDLVEGETLRKKMEQPIPLSEAVTLLVPVARALGYAHSKGIIHRDIKPSNILVGINGQPMLSDFGIAKILQAEETLDLTAQGVGIGTPEYMAPEQGMGELIDQRSDIYSLGVVFYEMVTGRKPYTAVTPMAVLHKQMSEPLPRPQSFNTGIPEEVEKILYKALSKDPGFRYQSMDDLALALEKIPLQEMNKENKKKPTLKRIAILLGILAMGALVWWVIWGSKSILGKPIRQTGIEPVASAVFVFPEGSVFQDDFEGLGVDSAKWNCPGNTCSAKKLLQSNGVLTVLNDSSAVGSGFSISSIPQWTTRQVLEVSADMMLDEFTGNSTSELILQLDATSTGFSWYTSCNLGGSEQGGYILCKVRTAGKDDYETRALSINLDQWYRVKIQIEPETNNLAFYLGDTWLGGYHPRDFIQIQRADKRLGVGAYSNGENHLIGYFDNVSVSASPESEIPKVSPVPGELLVSEDFNDGQITMYGYSTDSDHISITEVEAGNLAIKADNSERHDYIAFAIGDPQWKDYSIEFKLQISALKEELCILSRTNSSGTADVLCIAPEITYLAYQEPLSWQRVVNKYPPININTWHQIKIVTFQDSYQLFVDGNLWIDEKSASTSDGIQFASEGYSTVLIDDIVITELVGQ